jgi:hypothetical protein
MDMIRCPRCAKEIPDVSRFCRRCGSAVAWRAAMPPVIAPPPPLARMNRATTLTSPRPAQRESIITAGRKSNSVSGAGAFAILAAVGLVCFVNVNVRRAVSLPATPAPRIVRYPLPAQSPALPALPRTPRRVSPPVSYPIPLRSNAPAGSIRPPLPPSPPPGSIIIVEPPAAPWQWDEDEQERSARDPRTGTQESTAPHRYERRPPSR